MTAKEMYEKATYGCHPTWDQLGETTKAIWEERGNHDKDRGTGVLDKRAVQDETKKGKPRR